MVVLPGRGQLARPAVAGGVWGGWIRHGLLAASLPGTVGDSSDSPGGGRCPPCCRTPPSSSR